jgi:hypothetical protein
MSCLKLMVVPQESWHTRLSFLVAMWKRES